MSEPFLGELKLISWNFAPKGWAFCSGQLLPINQNQALFSLLGTMYGGNGQTNFALPNLQGRIAMHVGNGFTQGENGGETAHTLNLNELPAHTHTPNGSTSTADQASPLGQVWANNAFSSYAVANGPDSTMAAGLVGTTGGSQPHENMPPYLVLNYIIALQGIFPSQN
jgi:microcystin-dependent protein